VIVDEFGGGASDKLAMIWTAATYTAAFCAGVLGVLLVGRVFGGGA
jgi:hypothetical protein